ncbi:MAG: sulfite exporter TauE/SafE family protein [Candidatus Parcubacteria bacterium]|nr:sulfite exporter TauE/SafE family protein [Candidatus Parcubacteria bacterium]
MNKKIQFKIQGMHCQSCKTLIEEELKDLPGINKVNVDYQSGATEVYFATEKVAESEIYNRIKKLNYGVSDLFDSKSGNTKIESKSGYFLVIVFSIVILAGYFLIQYLGGFEILSKLTGGFEVGYGLILLIGLLAGFHCIGMCGSIVVTYSTLCLDDKKKSLWPHWQYNIGRIISYTIIGAILGGFGSFFGINPTFNGLVTIVAAIMMFFLGLSLVTRWSILEKLKIQTPQFIAKYIFSQKNKKFAPFIIGLLNGFMPCGPLQAMQLFALTSGNALKGALSLFLFALGTSILMFGFGAFLSFISQKHIKNILKLSGLLVIILSIFMLVRGLANFGVNIALPNINQQAITTQNTNINTSAEVQEVRMAVTYYGYEPNVLNVKKGILVRWIIDVKQMSGCNSQILMPDYNIKKNLQVGQNIIEFTPIQTGEIKFSCGMKMIWGKFLVE